EGCDAGAGGGEQRVDVSVVAAGELHDSRATGEAAGEADRRHRRLGAGADEPHLLDRADPGDDLLGELDLALGRRTEAGAAADLGPHRVDNGGMRMAEDDRAPGADEVDVVTAVG